MTGVAVSESDEIVDEVRRSERRDLKSDQLVNDARPLQKF